MYDEEDYALHIKDLKMILDYRLILEKFQRVIGFNQEAWLNIYVDMNAEIRKKTRNHFEREFFNLINNVEFGKPLKNLRNHRNIKLVTTDKKKKRKTLVSEPNDHKAKCFSEKLLSIEISKTIVIMNKAVYRKPCVTLGMTM